VIFDFDTPELSKKYFHFRMARDLSKR
jgi:hypothetical protein